MRSTLFYIPYEWNGVPVVGFGWLLIAFLILSAVIMAWLIRKQGWNQETASYLPFLTVFALIIAVLLPKSDSLPPSSNVATTAGSPPGSGADADWSPGLNGSVPLKPASNVVGGPDGAPFPPRARTDDSSCESGLPVLG